MSTNTQSQATPAVPEAVKAAEAKLRTEVRGRAVLEKLARDWHVVPRNQAEADQLLELADSVRQAKLNGQIKSASAQGNPFLDQLISSVRAESDPQAQAGIGGYADERLFKQAAEHLLAGDPALAAASTAYADYLLTLDEAA